MENQKVVTFRCPGPLVERVDELATLLGCTRNALVLEMIRVFSRQVRLRRGRVLPPYTTTALRRDEELPDWVSRVIAGRAENSSDGADADATHSPIPDCRKVKRNQHREH